MQAAYQQPQRVPHMAVWQCGMLPVLRGQGQQVMMWYACIRQVLVEDYVVFKAQWQYTYGYA